MGEFSESKASDILKFGGSLYKMCMSIFAKIEDSSCVEHDMHTIFHREPMIVDNNGIGE
jgi:hypothetical protein